MPLQLQFTSGVRSVSSKFEYDPEVSREINFRRWYEADTLEKEEFNEEPYTRNQAREVFENMYDLFEKIQVLK